MTGRGHDEAIGGICVESDFLRCDRRYRQTIGLSRFLDQSSRVRPESPIVFHGPDERVRVEYDQRNDAQSDGSAAGVKGSS